MANELALAQTLSDIGAVSRRLVDALYDAQQIIDRVDDIDLDQTSPENEVLQGTGLTLQEWGQAQAAMAAFVTLMQQNSAVHRTALNKAASVPRGR